MLREYGLLSIDSTAVGNWRGSELIANPNSSNCSTGMPMIIPKVSRSRCSWMNSLSMMPIQRPGENDIGVTRARRSHGPSGR